MVVLLGIAFLAGVITAVSPCVLPVLPIVLAGGAAGGRRRPYAIIAGLLTSFVVSILLVTWILRELGLPEDLLRNVSIGLLFLVATVMLVPQLGQLIERPLARIARGPSSELGGGFVLGTALGLAFVPCGGPILAYVSTQAASLDLGFKPVATAIAYALGASLVLQVRLRRSVANRDLEMQGRGSNITHGERLESGPLGCHIGRRSLRSDAGFDLAVANVIPDPSPETVAKAVRGPEVPRRRTECARGQLDINGNRHSINPRLLRGAGGKAHEIEQESQLGGRKAADPRAESSSASNLIDRKAASFDLLIAVLDLIVHIGHAVLLRAAKECDVDLAPAFGLRSGSSRPA